MKSSKRKNIPGWWLPKDNEPETGEQAIRSAILKVAHPVLLPLEAILHHTRRPFR
jgi:hypothetical protein